MTSLDQQLNTLPKQPGVYIFKDAKGNILYVGKAKLLNNRVRSYFQPGATLDPAKQQMVTKVDSVETISVDTETEALVLEANLIRQHQPPYNVVLRDDKYYLFIKITTREDFPRVFPVRRIKNDGARYFGPYSSAKAVRSTLRLLRRLFPHKAEKETPREQVFPHPLFSRNNPENEAAYKENIQNIIRFLSGQRDEIIKTLKAGMKVASKQKNFEQAAIFRDQLQAIERLEGSQKVYLPRKESFDVISLAKQNNRSAANIFLIRDGKLLNKNTFLLKHRSNTDQADILRQFLLQYYRVAQDIPKTIFIPIELEDAKALASWINKEVPPALTTPKRGKKRQLLALGETNAQQLLETEEATFETDARLKTASSELAHAIGLEDKPLQRVETYDISNIQGSLATASMVVFENGKPARNQYRKFKMKIDGTPNDFAMMQETLRRRFANRHKDWPTPDLVIIDGGKGQLSSAKKIMDELKVTSPVISIAKREEEIFIPNQKDPVRLPFNSDALYLIQRMRDEAHRFTITYHRTLRSKRSTRSILDEIPGIGPKTKKKLLNHFGSLKNIKAARDEELIEVIGHKAAESLKDYI